MKKIQSIEVTNSLFFTEGLKLNFSDKLNCIMGGRGTGKSTLLQFIKASVEQNAEEDRTTLSILKSNLGNGLIKINFETENGEGYRIEKSLDEDPQPYLSSTNRFVPIENIQRELTCDIFPAQIIEEIGRNSTARLDLIDRMLIGEIESLKSNVELLRIELEKNSKDIRSQNQKLAQKEEQLKDYVSAEEDLKNHRAELPPDINEVERVEFEKQDEAEKIRGAEIRFLKNLVKRINDHLESLDKLKDELTSTKSVAANTERFINKKIIDPLVGEIDKNLVLVLNGNSSNVQHLISTVKSIEVSIEKLKTLHEQQHNEFVQLKQKLDKHKTFYDKLNLLSKRTDERNVRLKDIEELKEKRKKLKSQREKQIKELNNLKIVIFNKRLEKIKELNDLFEGKIKITLSPGGISEEYDNALRNALKGNNMRYNSIVPSIVNNFMPDKLAKVIHEYDIEKLKTVSGIDIERSEAIMEALYETDAIYQIETIYCPDLPEFHLKVEREGDANIKAKDFYKKSDELSTGQRCTTVLPIVFAISNNPLIIDQPEDNLDNKYISETIHKIIREQKLKRQLIFITHNANIPVLSDAEMNVFLKYKEKKSEIDTMGTIPQVKTSILNLLEGGAAAFKKRKELYNIE